MVLNPAYHEFATPTVAPPLRPYEFVARPPIAFVLDAIVDHCGMGGSITPGVRELAKWAGVSAGQISPILYQLADDGWILYDGRVITLVRHPDLVADQLGADGTDLGADQESDLESDRPDLATDRIDQTRDRPDLAKDRFGISSAVNGTVVRQTTAKNSDLAKDRFRGRMVHVSHEQQQSLDQDSAAATKRHVPCAAQNDQQPDRVSPVVQALLEVGTNSKIIAKALAARPQLTAQEVRDTWSWHQWRIERSGGTKGDGVFFEAISCGQVHAAPPNSDAPIDTCRYVGPGSSYGGLFISGGATGPEETGPPLDDAEARARSLAPDATEGELAIMAADLADGARDDQVLNWLAERRGRERLLYRGAA